MRLVIVLALACMVAWAMVAQKVSSAPAGADLSLSVQSPPARIDPGQTVTYLFVINNPSAEAVRNVGFMVTWPASLQPVGPAQGGPFECLMLNTGDQNRQMTVCTMGWMSPGRGYIVQQMRANQLAHDYVTIHAVVISASDEAYWPNNAVDLSTKVGE